MTTVRGTVADRVIRGFAGDGIPKAYFPLETDDARHMVFAYGDLAARVLEDVKPGDEVEATGRHDHNPTCRWKDRLFAKAITRSGARSEPTQP